MEKIVILDFGSQYTQIIARKIRELNVYAEIYPFSIDIDTIKSIAPNGIILSGGPSSVYTENAPIPKFDVFSLGVPVLGICYGLQLIAYQLGGEVNKAAKREYGRANLIIDKPDVIFDGVSQSSQVWMSHGDSLTKIPDGFEIIAHTENAPIAAIRNQVKKIYGVQFHPEVHHSVEGIKILENFVRKICLCKEIWDMHSFVGSAIKKIQEEVGNSEVICALSGGVDSTVLAVLLSKAIGNKLHCIHIDTGLMRLQESEKLMKLFNDNFNISIDLVNASDIFLSRLKGVTDPELKRKIIGNTFIELFEIEAKKFNNAKWLAQGTLYPDVIESVS
ncbi:MAG TPA: glutamine-hydrolyzing GMP synthase, partial [Candidatus Kapabacteria bacterium]|nr:glutamine-hydrolyzing GMP synthase [Candidatus Kapabacteria bacterium]